MFSLIFQQDEPTELNEAIKHHIEGFAGCDEGSEEQKRHAETLKLLMEARKIKIETDRPWFQPSSDQVIAAAASLAGIICILTFEKWNVVTSKSLMLIMKPRT